MFTSGLTMLHLLCESKKHNHLFLCFTLFQQFKQKNHILLLRKIWFPIKKELFV